MSDVQIKREVKEDDNTVDITQDDDICELEHLRKLFIGGLAPYTTEDSLKSFYSQWGKVVDVVVMRDTNTKRSRGFGFITYVKSMMVDKAQENRPHIIDGKTVEAKRALPRPERESRETNISVKKLFVGGLKDNHDEECMQEYFSQFGRVVSIKLLTDKTTGKRRGFAFVEFDDYDAVDKAILQKQHSIKYSLVDVKKSIYNLEKKDKMAANANAALLNQANKPPPNMQKHQTGGYRTPAAQQQQQSMPAYSQHQPPPPMNAPPPNYNYWGPPPPMPQQYYQQPPPPQVNWNYPPAQNGWNGQQWHPNQWGCPPPQTPAGPPPPRGPAMTEPTANGNWNMSGPVQPVPGPPGATSNGAVMPPQTLPQQAPPPLPQQQQQQQPMPNFGSGYQQSYNGGPTKHNNMNANRMNPYNAPPNNGYANGAQVPPVVAYPGYNAGPPPVNAPGPVPKPVTNGNGLGSGNKYRR